jgi:Rod binding domain-containing protein
MTIKPQINLEGINVLASKSAEEKHGELVKHVETFVGTAFFGTLLKQMRESPFRSEMFGGGKAGENYDAMYHQLMSERMGKGAGRSLVDAIVRKITGKAAYEKQRDGAPESKPSLFNLAA